MKLTIHLIALFGLVTFSRTSFSSQICKEYKQLPDRSGEKNDSTQNSHSEQSDLGTWRCKSNELAKKMSSNYSLESLKKKFCKPEEMDDTIEKIISAKEIDQLKAQNQYFWKQNLNLLKDELSSICDIKSRKKVANASKVLADLMTMREFVEARLSALQNKSPHQNLNLEFAPPDYETNLPPLSPKEENEKRLAAELNNPNLIRQTPNDGASSQSPPSGNSTSSKLPKTLVGISFNTDGKHLYPKFVLDPSGFGGFFQDKKDPGNLR